jgi:RNA polymerase-interacting CarD/CdnL/TRCF family regulator
MSGRLRLAAREPGLDLGVGALIVYGGHGVGRVSARRPAKGENAEGATVVLEFPSGLSVILPLERAEECLRPPAGATECEAVRAALRARNTPIEQSWQARTRTMQTKIAVADPVGLAEIVRDAVERQRRFGAGATLSSAEQELYQKARRLLAAELAVAADIDEAEADAWIESHLDRDGQPEVAP